MNNYERLGIGIRCEVVASDQEGSAAGNYECLGVATSCKALTTYFVTLDGIRLSVPQTANDSSLSEMRAWAKQVQARHPYNAVCLFESQVFQIGY